MLCLVTEPHHGQCSTYPATYDSQEDEHSFRNPPPVLDRTSLVITINEEGRDVKQRDLPQYYCPQGFRRASFYERFNTPGCVLIFSAFMAT